MLLGRVEKEGSGGNNGGPTSFDQEKSLRGLVCMRCSNDETNRSEVGGDYVCDRGEGSVCHASQFDAMQQRLIMGV